MANAAAPLLTQEGVDDDTTLRLLATGLVQLADTLPPVRVPYSDPLQRGLNRLAWRSVRTNSPLVEGLADFLVWARRPIASWPISLNLGERDAIGPDDALLGGPDGDRPTDVCEELTLKPSPDAEAESVEKRLILDVLNLCRRPGGERTYTAYRRLLITQPVLTEDGLFTACEQPELQLLANHLRLDYQLAPLALAVDGQFALCPKCQNLVYRSSIQGVFLCDDSACAGAQGIIPITFLPVRAQVYWLRRELRRFVARPGRAEIALEERLQALGVDVELWPAVDAYDLRITFPRTGEVWAVDVKDWANAYYLANAVTPFRREPRWTRAFFVFPEARRDRQDRYLTIFTRRCQQRMARAAGGPLNLLDDRCQALFVEDFVRQVERQLAPPQGRRRANA
ncbi:MAG: hypothetical protein H0X24_02040 [Ktedonobacterales bacterium]|nr:hypothetical protein [Ktedonobacterales bacterium]